jgi:hypothetical protein
MKERGNIPGILVADALSLAARTLCLKRHLLSFGHDALSLTNDAGSVDDDAVCLSAHAFCLAGEAPSATSHAFSVDFPNKTRIFGIWAGFGRFFSRSRLGCRSSLGFAGAGKAGASLLNESIQTGSLSCGLGDAV